MLSLTGLVVLTNLALVGLAGWRPGETSADARFVISLPLRHPIAG